LLVLGRAGGEGDKIGGVPRDLIIARGPWPRAGPGTGTGTGSSGGIFWLGCAARAPGADRVVGDWPDVPTRPRVAAPRGDPAGGGAGVLGKWGMPNPVLRRRGWWRRDGRTDLLSKDTLFGDENRVPLGGMP